MEQYTYSIFKKKGSVNNIVNLIPAKEEKPFSAAPSYTASSQFITPSLKKPTSKIFNNNNLGNKKKQEKEKKNTKNKQNGAQENQCTMADQSLLESEMATPLKELVSHTLKRSPNFDYFIIYCYLI